ncbi:MAG: hypothetical protein ACLRH0_07125 [Blautia wexlerae]
MVDYRMGEYGRKRLLKLGSTVKCKSVAGKKVTAAINGGKISRSINTYERFVEQMRKAGKFYNPPVPQLGVMMESGRLE